jgi:hypothetical protein
LFFSVLLPLCPLWLFFLWRMRFAEEEELTTKKNRCLHGEHRDVTSCFSLCFFLCALCGYFFFGGCVLLKKKINHREEQESTQRTQRFHLLFFSVLLPLCPLWLIFFNNNDWCPLTEEQFATQGSMKAHRRYHKGYTLYIVTRCNAQHHHGLQPYANPRYQIMISLRHNSPHEKVSPVVITLTCFLCIHTRAISQLTLADCINVFERDTSYFDKLSARALYPTDSIDVDKEGYAKTYFSSNNKAQYLLKRVAVDTANNMVVLLFTDPKQYSQMQKDMAAAGITQDQYQQNSKDGIVTFLRKYKGKGLIFQLINRVEAAGSKYTLFITRVDYPITI